VKVILDLDLPGPLHAELQEAAKEAQCNPEVFAGECVQSILASRRLPRLRPAPHGARIGTLETGDMEEE
jgi:hypothetical protein